MEKVDIGCTRNFSTVGELIEKLKQYPSDTKFYAESEGYYHVISESDICVSLEDITLTDVQPVLDIEEDTLKIVSMVRGIKDSNAQRVFISNWRKNTIRKRPEISPLDAFIKSIEEHLNNGYLITFEYDCYIYIITGKDEYIPEFKVIVSSKLDPKDAREITASVGTIYDCAKNFYFTYTKKEDYGIPYGTCHTWED